MDQNGTQATSPTANDDTHHMGLANCASTPASSSLSGRIELLDREAVCRALSMDYIPYAVPYPSTVR